MLASPVLSRCLRCYLRCTTILSSGSAQYTQHRTARQQRRNIALPHLLHTSIPPSFSSRPSPSRTAPHRSAVACSASPPKTARDIVRTLHKSDVTITFARSGGAGGQNVNKVNTKVDMRLKLDAAAWISVDLRDALVRLEKKRINKEGELVVTSTLTRSQADNVEDALEKLQACLDAAAETLIPAEINPEKQKQMAKQKRIANENRLDDKKKSSAKKQERRAKIEW